MLQKPVRQHHPKTENGRTISRAVGEEDEAEVGMHDDVALPLLRLAHTPAVRERKLPVSGQTTEDSDDVLCGLVGLIYDDDSPEGDRAQEGRVCVLDDAVL